MCVLSLFDGISCGQIALERSGTRYSNYYASEVDRFAIQVTQHNYPNTIQLGDINNWGRWKLPSIDLLLGGSPCQGFSVAGGGKGFDDQRSGLFFKYVDILLAYQPTYFLLENVKMKQEWCDIITGLLCVDPIVINSALVSAQNRVRMYWTNIPNITQPEDKGIMLKDIIEGGNVDRDKSYCIDANYFKSGSLKIYFDKKRRQLAKINKYQSQRRLMVRCDHVGEADIKGIDSMRRVYSIDAKCPTLSTCQGGHREPKITTDDVTWRKLTPLECERLQTVPDNYTAGVSNTQRYKMLGNGYTVDVIAHILKCGGLHERA